MSPDTTRPVPAPQAVRRDQFERIAELHWPHAGPVPATPPAGGRWLLATDGSARSQRAAAELARLAVAGLRLAADVVAVQGWLAREAAEAGLAERGWAQAAPARDTLLHAGLAVDVHVVMGNAAEAILAMADKLGSAGIVVGARGLGAVESMLLGSVAEQVVRQAKVPVLVVH